MEEWRASGQGDAARLGVEADHIDIRDFVRTGIQGAVTLNGGMTQTVDRRGYGLVELRSRGDLRFLSSTAATPASLPFGGFPRPAPCSPAATCCWRRSASIRDGSAGLAVAGVRDANTFDPERALRVQRVDGSLSAVTPLSAFGRLALMAPTVEQGGVLHAPLGAIQLGSTGANINRSVRLLPGS